MAEGNALGAYLSPNVSSYSNPTVNNLLAAGGTGSNAMTQGESNALSVAQQAQGLQSGQVQISQQQFTLAKQKFDALHQIYQSLVADPTQDNVNDQLIEGVKQGIVDPDTAQRAAAHFMAFGGDRNKIQQAALNGMNINADHQDILQQAYGQPGLVNTGSATVSTLSRTGPNAGTTLSGAPPIANTTSPAEKMGGLTVKNPDGSSTFKPNSTIYDERGNFIGDKGAASIPVYRGGGGGAPMSGGNGQGASAPPAPASAAPAAPAAAAGAPSGVAPAGKGADDGHVPVGYPSSSGNDSGSKVTVPVGGPASLGGHGAASSGTWTPGLQTMPVVSVDAAKASLARIQAGQGTAIDRNALRGWAVQNDQPLGKLGDFEPQPGQAPQAPAASSSGPVAQAAGPTSTGGAVQPGRQPPAPAQSLGPGGGIGSGSGNGGLTVGLSPGREASLKAGADGYSSLSSDVSNPSGVSQRLFQLRTALGALRNTQTGLGTAQRQQLVGYLASLPGGLAKWAPGVDPDSASAYDIATKYLTAYSLNTPGAARSDAGLSTAQGANANTASMMQKAAQDVTLSNIGLENGKQALLNSFNASGADPGSFGKFASQWMQGTDPRAFALPDMTPAERGQLYGGLQGPARAAFLATVKKGIAAKILTPNDLQGAAANGQ